MNRIKSALLLVTLALLATSASAQSWWDAKWTVRKLVTLDTTETGTSIGNPVDALPVLLRLSDANFQFDAANQEGTDIRFVSADGKTLLPFQIERYDSLMHEGYVWVKAPPVAPGSKVTFWIYYGNPEAPRADDPAGTYGPTFSLAYHFAGSGVPAQDASGNGNDSAGPATTAEGSYIGAGLRLTGAEVLEVPASASLAHAQGGAFTVSVWFRESVLQPNGIIFSRQDNGSAFRLGVDNGVPFAEVVDATLSLRTPAGAKVNAAEWHHLTATYNGSALALYLDGAPYGAPVQAALPAMNSALHIGGDIMPGATGMATIFPAGAAQGTNFAGDLDELDISNVARSADHIKLAVATQAGGDKTAAFMTVGPDEQPSSWLSALKGGYVGIIIQSLTVDGWVVIIILGIMSFISWIVMIGKGMYLRTVGRGNEVFLDTWEKVAADLSVLEAGEGSAAKTLGLSDDEAEEMERSPLYRVYTVGMHEIHTRQKAGKAITSSSLQAIRASLDAALTREQQRLNKLIVLLTIAISGGPFLGLLGTVVGVMITFAAVAAAGDVNVNAIAPGIAAALAATVAGLAVAIPALFGYNYLLTRIKEASTDMHVFIDEFVTKLAEFYADAEVEA